jgi:hypothetical protein
VIDLILHLVLGVALFGSSMMVAKSLAQYVYEWLRPAIVEQLRRH